MNYVIVGNSAAGIGAIEGIRRLDSQGQITLIASEPYHTYSRPLISYYLSGKVTADKMYYRGPEYYERLNVQTRLGETVKTVDVENSAVVLESGERIPYDKLVIATGGKPISPPIPGKDLQGVFAFHKWDDVKGLDQNLFPGARVLVIGAGLIGLKAAEALIKRQAQVKIAELSNRVLSAILDEQAAQIVQEEFEHKGAVFFLNNTVKEILGKDGKVCGAQLQDGSEVECDMVIIAIGVTPNTDLVQGTPVKTNRGIVVNDQMLTSCEHIYAAGDVAEGYDRILGEQRVIPILPNAFKQGFTAGMNMAGGNETYPGGFAMNSIGFFDLPMITAGIVKVDDPKYNSLIAADFQTKSYRKVILHEDRIVGFIALNKVDRAGILTGLMDKQVDVSAFKAHLLQDDFGYIYFPQEYRKQQLYKGGILSGIT